MSRSCGECSACCRLPEVPEINKPEKTPCQHLCNKGYGCKIYQNRPMTCSNYQCCWLMGHGAEGDRPDKTGVLVELRDTQFGTLMVAKSFRSGAVNTKRGAKAIDRIAKNSICFVTNDENMDRVAKIRGPEHLVQQFKAIYGIK